jgi:hypothetical protein
MTIFFGEKTPSNNVEANSGPRAGQSGALTELLTWIRDDWPLFNQQAE